MNLTCTRVAPQKIEHALRELDALALMQPHTVHQLSSWYLSYLQATDAVAQTRLLEVRESSGQLVGALPLQIEEHRGTRYWNHRYYVHLTKGPADFFNILVRPGYESAVASALARWLYDNRNQWEQFQLDLIPESSLCWQELTHQLNEHGFDVQTVSERGYYYIDTTQDWNEYNSRFLHKKLADMRNRRNRLRKHGLEPRVVEIRSGISDYLSELFSVYDKRRKQLGQNYATSSIEMQTFLSIAIKKYEKLNKICLSMLQNQSNDTLAYQLDWIDQGVRYHYKPTFRSEYAQYSPSKILLFETIKQSFEDPTITEFNFMRGESPYKTQFTNKKHRYISIEIRNTDTTRAKATQIASKAVKLRNLVLNKSHD